MCVCVCVRAVRVCVFCFGFFPLDKQLLQAILHLSTLELSIEMAQTKKEETHTNTTKQQQQGKKIQTTSFGTAVQLLSSSNKQ